MEEIVVENLKYKYPLTDKLALNDISFKVKRGEFIGIIGKNSSGKSTLCQALVGLIPHFYKGAYGGKVFVCNMEVLNSRISDIVKKVGLVFQNPFTQITGSKLSVYEEISFGLENLGMPRNEMIERIDYSLKLLDIYKHKDRSPFELSGGQMQRVAVASVISMSPEIIILDEPTSQLDPQGSEEVYKAIEKLSEDGKTVIMVDHKMEKIAKYASKIMLLSEGRIVDFDVPEKVFSKEDLESYGVTPPVYTKICRGLKLKDMKTGLYPVTLEDACSLVVKNNE
ncbi:cobalt ABC transporter ATP-binding protein [Clostridium sp. DMHC 10]|nr:cobalt ABC transporter ATP-binding protein [Clostridium sp. DMHC 10]